MSKKDLIQQHLEYDISKRDMSKDHNRQRFLHRCAVILDNETVEPYESLFGVRFDDMTIEESRAGLMVASVMLIKAGAA